MCFNGAYFVVVLRLAEAGDEYNVNSGKFSILDGFSLFIASIVVFKVFFAFLNIVKWRCRYMNNREYRITNRNLEKDLKDQQKKKKSQK